MEQQSILSFPDNNKKLPAYQLTPAVAVDLWEESDSFDDFYDSITDKYYGVADIDIVGEHIAIIFLVNGYTTGIIIKT